MRERILHSVIRTSASFNATLFTLFFFTLLIFNTNSVFAQTTTPALVITPATVSATVGETVQLSAFHDPNGCFGAAACPGLEDVTQEAEWSNAGLTPEEQQYARVVGQGQFEVIVGADILVAARYEGLFARATISASTSVGAQKSSFSIEYCCATGTSCSSFGSLEDAQNNCGADASPYSCSHRQNHYLCESCCEVDGLEFTVFDQNDCSGVFHFGQQCTAPQNTIGGTVVSPTGEPLQDIQVKSGGRLVLTNSLGEFDLEIPAPGTHLLEFKDFTGTHPDTMVRFTTTESHADVGTVTQDGSRPVTGILVITLPSDLTSSFDITVEHAEDQQFYCDISIDDTPVTSIFTLDAGEVKTVSLTNVAAGSHTLDGTCSTDVEGTAVLTGTTSFDVGSAFTKELVGELIVEVAETVSSPFDITVSHTASSPYYCGVYVDDEAATNIFILESEQSQPFTLTDVAEGNHMLDVICSVDVEGTDVLTATRDFVVS